MSLVNIVDNRVFDKVTKRKDIMQGEFFCYKNNPQSSVYVSLGPRQDFRFNDSSVCTIHTESDLYNVVYKVNAVLTISNI